MVSVDMCYCGERATVSVPGWRCTRRICAECHHREQDGPRLLAERRARADRESRERIAACPRWACPRCSDCGTEPQQYYFRQRPGRRLPPGYGLCWVCVYKPAPESDAQRVDRRIAVLRMVRAALRNQQV
jgi:hypothetical protein